MAKVAQRPGRGGRRAGSGRKPRLVESLREARRRKEVALADLRELEVRQKRGELLAADEVARAWEADSRRIQAAVLAVPSRIRSALPHLTPHDAAMIDAEIRAALGVLADADPA